MLQIAASHRSVRYNTNFPPPFHSNFDKGWRGDHKHKFMEGLSQNTVQCLKCVFNWL